MNEELRSDLFARLAAEAEERGDWEGAVEACLGALQAAVESQDQRTQAGLCSKLSQLLARQGRYREAEEFCRRALVALTQVLGPDHAELGVGWGNLGQLLETQEQIREAEWAYEESARILGAEGPEGWTAHQLLGEFRLRQQRLPEAAQALELAVASGVPQDEELGQRLHTLCHIYDALGQNEDADRARSRALDVMERVWGSDSPRLGQLLSNMAESLSAQGRLEAAAALYERAWQCMQSLGPDSQAALAVATGWMQTVVQSGDAQRGQEVAEHLMAKCRGGQGAAMARLMNEVGMFHFVAGRPEAAVACFEAAFAAWQDTPGQPILSQIVSHYNLGSALAMSGRLEPARGEYEVGLSLAEEHLSEDHELTMRLLIGLSEVWVRLEQSERAAELRSRVAARWGQP